MAFSDGNTVNELFPGSMNDEESAQADKKLGVGFEMHHVPDYIATNGGWIEGEMRDGKPVSEEFQERIDELLAVGCRFRRMPKMDMVLKVLPAGRPIYRDVEFISIYKPGDRDNIVVRAIEDKDRARFKEKYERWAKNHEAGTLGTPLEELPFLNSALREELRYFNVRTAEELANMSESNITKFPIGRQIQERAKRYLDAAEKKAPFDEIHQEIKLRDEQIGDLTATVESLKAKLEAFETGGTKTRKG